MKTINIKGKDYVPVVERVKEFHNLYPEGSITTQVISNDEKRCVVQATVKIPSIKKNTPEGGFTEQKIFTGLSQASWTTGMMKDVALEVAETSAIGRALGFANIGLLDGIASAEEMRKVGKSKSIMERDDAPFGDMAKIAKEGEEDNQD